MLAMLPIEHALISLALFRSIYQSAATLALNRNFGDVWASQVGSKKVHKYIQQDLKQIRKQGISGSAVRKAVICIL